MVFNFNTLYIEEMKLQCTHPMNSHYKRWVMPQTILLDIAFRFYLLLYEPKKPSLYLFFCTKRIASL